MWREETTTERVCVSGDQGESSYIYRTKNLVRGRDVEIWGWRQISQWVGRLLASDISERSRHLVVGV
jgi:hypothetical protein